MKKYFIYPLLFFSTILFAKTVTSFFSNFFFYFSIKVPVGINYVSCETIFNSILENTFYTDLFLFSLLGVCLSLFILSNDWNKGFQKIIFNKQHTVFLISAIVSCLFLYATVWYIWFILYESNLFDKHFIFHISFFVSLLTVVFYTCFLVFVYIDLRLTLGYKYLVMVLLFLFCYDLLYRLLGGFIFFYGFSENIGLYVKGFDNILFGLGLGTFCMDEPNDFKDT